MLLQLHTTTLRRHVWFTLVALSLSCQAFVTSSRFGTSPPMVVRGGATPLSTTNNEQNNVVSPLGVLRSPTRSRGTVADDDDGDRLVQKKKTDKPSVVQVSTKGLYKPNNMPKQPIPPVDKTNNNNESTVAFSSQRVAYVAETKLPTDVGNFQLRGYKIPGAPVGQEPCVIYARDKPPFGTDGAPAAGVPVRIHDQCLTSEVFRSQR